MNLDLRTVVLLARHGATSANSQQPPVLQGSTQDHELDALGRQQAEALGDAMNGFPVAAVYSSPLLRARQTASYVCRHHALEPTIAPGIHEVEVGQWEGLSWEEIARQWPSEHGAFLDDAERHGYLGGENLGQVRDRCLVAFGHIVAEHPGETVVVVAHNVVNRVVLAHWMDIPIRYARRIPQDNTGFNVVHFSKRKTSVRVVNSIWHLTGLPQAP